MKKYLLSFFVFLFLLSFPRLVWAQNYGYNVVNNFYNQDGTFNDKVFELLAGGTATVRLISGEIRAHPGLIGDIEAAARRYGVNLVWQPEDWHATTPEEFDNFWREQLSQITMGTISLFTEYNYFDGDPADYAAILQSALRAGFQVPIATTNFNITNPTGAGMTEYLEFLRQVEANCNCLNQIPVWSVSIYGRYDGTNLNQAVDDFLNQLQGFKNSLVSLGVDLTGKTIIIPEAGLDPSKPISERLNLAVQFAQELENRGAPGVEAITFLLMDDKTGKQYLIVRVCDGAGNCQWVIMDYDDFGIIGLSGPERWDLGEDYGITTGESFEICGRGHEDLVARAREIALTYFEVANINPIGQSASGALEKIILPGQDNETEDQQSRGYIELYYCEKGVREWPRLLSEERIWFETPDYYQQMATATYQIGDLMTPAGESISHPLRAKTESSRSIATANKKETRGIGENPGAVLAEQSFAFILDPSSSCVSQGGGISCSVGINGTIRYGHMWVNINGQFLGINAVPGPGAGYNWYSYNGACGADGCSFTLTVVNLDYPEHPTLTATCAVQAGETSCSFVGGQMGPPPEPPLCELGTYTVGGQMANESVSFSGRISIPFALASLKRIWDDILGWIESLVIKTYIIIPTIGTPWTYAAEQKYRLEVATPFTLPGNTHLYEAAEVPVKYEGSDSGEDKKGSIYGAKGEDETYNYMRDILTPPGR